MFYLAHVNDSDGNDNTIRKLIIEADSLDAAYDKACEAVEARLKDNNVEWESDGEYGGFYACDCEIPEGSEDAWECSHGGWTVYIDDKVDVYATLAEAEKHLNLEYWNPTF